MGVEVWVSLYTVFREGWLPFFSRKCFKLSEFTTNFKKQEREIQIQIGVLK
jgi:hypothetical protein